MIKKILLFVVCIWGLTFYAQDQSKNQIFVGAGAQQEINHAGGLNINMQVGSPILFNTSTGAQNTSVAFPYSILYVPNTFISDKYQISKGYYPDRVRLTWEIGANENIITNIQIFRKELGTDNPEQRIATLAKDVFEYNDFQTQGGQLYEYRVKAQGVSEAKEEEFFNFIKGIGFRNPTATVSGNISYEGGNPVKDVTVYAEAVGAENSAGTSIYINGGYASTGRLNKNINADKISIQAWSSFVKQDNAGDLFYYSTSNGQGYSIVSKITSANVFVVDVYKNNNYIFNIHVRGSLPTGEIDALGNDIYKDINQLTNNDFYHLSFVMEKDKEPKVYINAREMTQDKLNNATVSANITKPVVTFFRTAIYNPDVTEKINQIDIGATLTDVNVDEVRVWDRILTEDQIRKDYRRYLNGSENGLKIYLRADENAGDFLYDISKVGNIQNENHARLIKDGNNGSSVTFSLKVPRRDQLGVFGVTDKNGSYTIAAIPYAGSGESFEITPSLGVHEFNPATQTLFLGRDEPVVNKVDFIDISSFTFRGKAIFNVQDVFKPIATTEPTNLRDSENYNQYLLGNALINKGEYYYEGGTKNPNTGFYEGGVLKQYPVIGVGGATILVDGNIVFDEDNQRVLTNEDGTFSIDVPIGRHKVELEKNGHTFALNGRFPEEGTFEFFEDQIEIRYFIDSTRVDLVGKVVGGKKEFEKPIGFGFEGKKEYTNFEDLETEVKETISSNNNIGVAQITFKGDVNSSSLDKIITTNSETGEFKAALIPYQYNILQNGITIPTNTDVSILTSTETLDLREIPDLKTSEFTTKDNTVVSSDPYHYVKSFRYNSDVAVYLLDQEFDTEFTIEDKTFDISALNTPIYTQREKYKFTFEVVQEYINNDADEPVTTKEFFTEGAFNITNNLAQSDTQEIVLKDNNTKYEYSFNAGLPNITVTDGFAQNIAVQYVIEGSNPLSISNLSDFKSSGIVKGGRPSAGKTFVTSAPEVPEVILRDPPGTNSYATIEKGTSIKMKTSSASTDTGFTNFGLFTSIGPDVTFSKGVIFASVDTNIDVVADFDLNFTRSTENTSANETEITYTFNQSISTSDDPSFVGADGDLFIGNAKNIYYGIFDNIFITENIPLDLNNATIPNLPIVVKDEDGNDKNLYISTSKDYFIAEQPTNTFFTYSQKYIVETLIPDLERLAATGSTSSQGVEAKSATYYTAQADLWKKVVQNNEKAKYDAKNNREAVKNGVIASVVNNLDPSLRSGLTALVNENFYSNRSFDAGLGEFSNSISTSVLTSNTYTSTIDVENEFALDLGFFINGVGRSMNYTTRTGSVDTDSNTTSQDISNTISYTLKDNDKSNLLSVDVVSMFDGNGPVFITRGGTTSCPYEGETTSIFFKNDGFDANVIGAGGEVLSEATNKVYNAEISVEKNLITNVPESEAAVFKVYLKNTSETQTDLEFILDFDSTTLNGAEISLETNGTNIFLPFNETIEFPIEITKSSSSSRFSYEDIKLYLYSPCAFASEKDEISIEITAEFKKSCSNVVVSAPENNFIFNNNEAYSVDINGNTTANTLPITFTDFNVDFSGFNKIELQYRNASASNWTKFASYYGSEALKTTAGDTEGIVISSSDADFTYNWDIVADNIPDGNYEIRAVSYCTDNITNTSDIISGIINLNAPVVFGTPKPTDGILDVGEDVTVRFNEPIFKRITSEIRVTGLKNQQEIDHSVSVYLDGSSNQIELPNQRLNNQSFALQFWFNNSTTGQGNLVAQENGINIGIDGNHLDFSIGNQTVSTKTNNRSLDASQYNFYSFVYQNGNSPQLLILENGQVLEAKVLDEEIDFNTAASIFIGGTNVVGNLHDIRMWSKPFTPAQATVAKDVTLTGRELNLQGYWKLDEGFGGIAIDKAKRKNATVALAWDIFPKGTGYEFKNNEHLTLNNVGFVQPTHLEDITLSFWIKPDASSKGTIFSNGKGADSEPTLTNGYRNKWAINLKENKHLELTTENETFQLTLNNLEVDSWSHVAIVLKRGSSLSTFVNGNEESAVSSAKIGGISGNKIVLGGRLFQYSGGSDEVDDYFTGLLDEVRLWNTARSFEQIKRDRYFEVNKETTGLLLYVDFNEDATNTSNGPAYNHADRNLTTGTTFAVLSGANQNYVQDSPPLKPQLQFTNIPFSTVINGDEMIITPELTAEEWSLYEGEIINFSVARMSDTHFNTQNSPVTWSALVNRQEIEWFTQDQTKEIITQKIVGETYSFTMDVVNIGGSNQPYTLSSLPVWLQADKTSGAINANSSRTITFTVDKDLAMGNYTADIFLQTASGFNDRLSFNLRVLSEAPNWAVNPQDFDSSMNVIGKIEINGSFSRDAFTKVGAFIDDEPKGEAYLIYDAFYDAYFTYLTIYNSQELDADNIVITKNVTFKIWDAINGKIITAAIDNVESVPFIQNDILGSNDAPKVFSTTTYSEQNIALNKGWSWMSFYADDSRFSNLAASLIQLDETEGDIIKSQVEFANYENSKWNGNLKALNTAKMYKIKLAKANNLLLKGPEVDISKFIFTVEGKANEDDVAKWNWLPFPIHKNVSIQEALAFFDASNGDVIKDQFNFAIYNTNSGWRGTLNYLEANKGYMLKSSKTQSLKYPNTSILQKTSFSKSVLAKQNNTNEDFTQYASNMNIVAEVIADENFTKVLVFDMNNQLRGTAEISEIDNKKYSFITVFSNQPETLKYVLANDFEEVDINMSFEFESNKVVGDFENPILLSASALSLENAILNEAVLYPNPFTNEINVDFSSTSFQISKVEVFNTIGVSIVSKKINQDNKITLNTSNLANGIYLIRLTNDLGETVLKKMIKK